MKFTQDEINKIWEALTSCGSMCVELSSSSAALLVENSEFTHQFIITEKLLGSVNSNSRKSTSPENLESFSRMLLSSGSWSSWYQENSESQESQR